MEITERLMYIMKLNNLSPSAFADKINVQRSSVSHLLSGRNKPSLELIQKVILAFPKVNADWLISGRQIQNEPLMPIPETPNQVSSITAVRSSESNSGCSDDKRNGCEAAMTAIIRFKLH